MEVFGKNVIYKNFEITCLGNISRDEGEERFEKINGLNHLGGRNCEFIQLKIYNNSGSGIGSWKYVGGSIIEECVIYNNGFIYNKGRGSGVGIYSQNLSDQTRVFRNNIIFNNFYKGIQIWSANKNSNSEYVKNYLVENNVVFNNGLPAGYARDNLLVATDDRKGNNIAKNIRIAENILYHNTNFKKVKLMVMHHH